MLATAAALDAHVHANAGRCALIVALWMPYERARIDISVDQRALSVAWAVRRRQRNGSRAPLGPNSFQLVLHADGSIDINYGALAERYD